MPFIPHTEAEITEMLATLGLTQIEDLFSEISPELRIDDLPGMPEALSELEVTQLLQKRMKKDHAELCFIGAGAYGHHVPSAILDLISRGEFLTCYTPYQAEASQGSLQLIYEYQSMMTQLTGMDVSNASLYDGASALAEAILMAVRANRCSKSKRILVPKTVHPYYRATIRSIVAPQALEIVEIPYNQNTGHIDLATLAQYDTDEHNALIIPQPNFFGVLEEVDELTDWARRRNMMSIALVNPTSLALLKEPGCWGSEGADIVCGEGQPLGIPLASGGPYFGFLCCKQTYVRQMPGRIIGRTVDVEGKTGFTLTLQAREQHIRRSKATSNICTNQGLMVVAATIYMSLLGAEGLRRVAASSHHNAVYLSERLREIEGIEQIFSRPFFHEWVVRCKKPVAQILDGLAKQGIQGGLDLTPFYPELGQALLLCTTETKTVEDLDTLVSVLKGLPPLPNPPPLIRPTATFSHKGRRNNAEDLLAGGKTC